MKSLTQHITEKLVLNNNTKVRNYQPTNKEELIKIIKVEVKQNGLECDLNHIDVSQITDLSGLFRGLKGGYNLEKFNGDISKWDVSNVHNMEYMFWGSKFNGDISNWDVSKVTDMAGMFGWSKFTGKNGDISKWDVSNVEDMRSMFLDSNFNKNISGWDVSNVTDMSWMFMSSKFNKDISNWKINKKCNVELMFRDCQIKEQYKPKGIE